jgi:hypothetical protein
MASEFPGSPKLLKGAMIAYAIPDLLPTIIVFQYNPDQMTRSLTPRLAHGGGRGDAQRVDGPPQESITFTAELDATDQLERSDGIAGALGLHPQIAALEKLMYPAFPLVLANQILAAAGSSVIASESAPLALLIWGPNRVLPVGVASLAITEQAFDTKLNPIRASVNMSVRVLTYRELDFTNPGYWVYMASFAQKEVFAAIGSISNAVEIGVNLSF